jgi:hypothetical protein
MTVQLLVGSSQRHRALEHGATVEIGVCHLELRHETPQLGQKTRPARANPSERDLSFDDRECPAFPTRQILQGISRNAVLRWRALQRDPACPRPQRPIRGQGGVRNVDDRSRRVHPEASTLSGHETNAFTPPLRKRRGYDGATALDPEGVTGRRTRLPAMSAGVKRADGIHEPVPADVSRPASPNPAADARFLSIFRLASVVTKPRRPFATTALH